MTTTDHVQPGARWTFDDEVTQAFDDMLRRSIPQYDTMRELVNWLARWYSKPGSVITDLGSSRGEAVAELVATLDRNLFQLVETSGPMLDVLRHRFRGEDRVIVSDMDLTRSYPQAVSHVTLSILTMQFIPLECRLALLKQVYDHTAEGGVFIMVEKVLGGSAELDGLMVQRYYDMKEANGYTREDIDRKRLSLQGVLVPCTADWNVDMLTRTGFRQVDCFWRWMNFAGWLAVKD